MKTTIRRVGNSKGILLPAAVLAVCNICDEVELGVQDGRIFIEPIKASREAWFDNYRAADEKDAWGELHATDADSADWEW